MGTREGQEPILIFYEGSLFSVVGGGREHLVGLSAALAELGQEVVLIAPASSGISVDGVEVRLLPAVGPFPIRLATYEIAKCVEFMRLARAERASRRVLLTRLSASAPAVLVARRCGFEVIVEVNGPLSKELQDRGGLAGKLLGAISRFVERVQLEQAKRVVCVAPGLHSYVDVLAPTAQTKVLPNGARDPSVTVPADRSMPLRIAYLGAVSHWYDLAMVVRVVDSMQNGSSLEIIGDGTGLEQLRHTPSESARIHGWTAPDEADRILRRCHVGVIPCASGADSAAMRSPLKLYHYLSLQLEVVVADVVELEDAVKPFVHLYETGNETSFRNALQRASDSPLVAGGVPREVWAWESRAKELLEWIS